MANFSNSSTVAAGDTVLATQYNNVRKDTVINAGDYNTSGGSSNAFTLTLDSQITAYVTGMVIKFKANFDITGACTINVNSIGAKTIKKKISFDLVAGDIKNGEIVVLQYDGTNFQMVSNGATRLKFGGNGSDGALTISAGTTTINLGGVKQLIKNYSSISITGTGQLAFSNPHADGTEIILKCSGDVTLTSSTAPNIEVSGLGSTGGVVGTPGTNGNFILDSSNHFGTNATIGSAGTGDPGAGGGGGGSLAAGSDGSNAVAGASVKGNGGAVYSNLFLYTVLSVYYLARKALFLAVGSGGGAGANGEPAANSAGGGGGGGGGGQVLILYNSLTANSGTITVTGGAAGAGGIVGGAGVGAGGAGGRGGGCLVIECAGSLNFTGTIYAKGAAGTAGGNGGALGGGGAGGAGGAGGSLVAQNTELA